MEIGSSVRVSMHCLNRSLSAINPSNFFHILDHINISAFTKVIEIWQCTLNAVKSLVFLLFYNLKHSFGGFYRYAQKTSSYVSWSSIFIVARRRSPYISMLVQWCFQFSFWAILSTSICCLSHCDNLWFVAVQLVNSKLICLSFKWAPLPIVRLQSSGGVFTVTNEAFMLSFWFMANPKFKASILSVSNRCYSAQFVFFSFYR